MNNREMAKAIKSLSPDAIWTLNGVDYENIIWENDAYKPTLAEIEAEIAALPAKEAAELEAKQAQKQAILDRLGLTEDEAKLLLS